MPEKAERWYDPELGYRQYKEGTFQRVVDNLQERLPGAFIHRDVAYGMYYNLMHDTESAKKFAKNVLIEYHYTDRLEE